MDDPDTVDREGRGEDGPFSAITVFLVLGAGLLAMFAGVDWFWMVWVFGFAVVLPMVGVLERHLGGAVGTSGRYAPDHHERARGDQSENEKEAALARLKRRYAEGEIDELEFERRLEGLVENESIDDVQRRFEDGHGSRREAENEYEHELE